MENERMNFEPMKPDHTTSQGPGCGLIAGKRSPIALVCALLLVALSGCGALLSGRAEAWKVQCSNSLKQIYFAAVHYAEKENGFPLDESAEKPRAQDSLNILLKSKYGKNLPPHLFKCPASSTTSVSSEGVTNDYAWVNVQRLPNDKRAPLAACSHHEGVLLVLFTDSSVVEWDLNDPEVKAKLDPETGLPKGLGR
jgi:hypothetical protein